MTWLQRYRYRHFLRASLWVAPTLGMVSALATASLLRPLGEYLGLYAVVSPEAARVVVSSLAGSMLTFIVFVLTALLVAVQLASAQMSPRIISRARQSSRNGVCLGIFMYSYTFSLATLARIDAHVPLLQLRLCIGSNLLSICVFLYLVDRLLQSLRPIAIMSAVALEGAEVIRKVYPQLLDDVRPRVAAQRPTAAGQVVEHTGRSGVLLAFDVDGLVKAAQEYDALIELLPQVGDFVVHGDPLFQVHATKPWAAGRLRSSLAFGSERTIDQDPTFSLRIIVDVASRGLSPAINDPTTAVLALDQLHMLLRLVGLRHLDTGLVHDEQGVLRLAFRTPDWEDFVALGLTEIRQFGAGSTQVCRRLRAMLEHLSEVLSPERRPTLQEQLELLDLSIERSFPDPKDRAQAALPDLQGLGGQAP